MEQFNLYELMDELDEYDGWEGNIVSGDVEWTIVEVLPPTAGWLITVVTVETFGWAFEEDAEFELEFEFDETVKVVGACAGAGAGTAFSLPSSCCVLTRWNKASLRPKGALLKGTCCTMGAALGAGARLFKLASGFKL